MTHTSPHATRRSPPFFYGYVMAAIAITMACMSMPGQTVIVALFNPSFLEAFDLSLTELSLAYTIATIVASLPLALVGRAADRLGLRRVVPVIAIAFACALAYVALLRASGLAAAALLTLGFLFIRFLGQGSLGMLAGHTLAMWFERRLGTMHAVLAIVGFSAASAVLPKPTAWMIESIGWRHTLLVFAGAIAALAIPLAVLFRNRPEDIGQHLDGDPAEHPTHDVMHGGPPPVGDPAFNLRQAVRAPAYWILASHLVLPGVIGTALLFHMSTILQSAGAEGTEAQAASAILSFPIGSGVAHVVMGLLADRMTARPLLVVAPILMIASCLIALAAVLTDLPPVVMMAAAMGTFGLAMGAAVSVANPAIARFFGRTHHGSIRGTVATATVAGTGAGPFLAALGYEAAGQSFTWVLVAFAAACLPILIATLFLARPEPPESPDFMPDPDDPDPVIT